MLELMFAVALTALICSTITYYYIEYDHARIESFYEDLYNREYDEIYWSGWNAGHEANAYLNELYRPNSDR